MTPSPSDVPSVAARDLWFDPVRVHRWPVAAVAVVVSALLCARIGVRPDLPAYLLLGVAGTMLACIDIVLMRLPDPLTLPCALGVLALLTVASLDLGADRILHALAGAGALFTLYAVLWLITPRLIGLGDVKLALSLGLGLGWLGPRAVVLGLLTIHLIAGLYVVPLLVTGKKTSASPIAFGPAMLIGTLITVLLQA